ncbi:MAG: glutathione S-transferase [Janthinobacterium lividum]
MTDGTLVLGTKRYSSWSLRGWLMVRLAGLDVVEQVIRLAGGATSEIAAATPNGLVPYLEHGGNQVWESLAIGEYCAELAPALWPADLRARTHARVLAAEMHAGFRPLRLAIPMNLGRDRPLSAGIAPDVQADIDRLDYLWSTTRATYGAGGSFLFGADFTVADAMFAPVVARFSSYGVSLSTAASAYRDAVLAHPLMLEWYEAAAAEPVAWQLDRYESVA